MSAATPETELDVYWGPSFAKDLAKGFPHIETLCLRFSESYPEPPIINWYIIEQELEGSLPDLKNLYIINETKDTEYVPPVYINEQPRRPFNAQDLKSLRILHLPWEIVYRMRSIPPHLNRGLEELVIDVNGYVVGPLEHTKWEMVELMEDMRKVHTLIPNCNLIIWKGWAVSEEVDKKWKEGQMTEDEYHKEVVQDLVEQNNKKPWGTTMARVFNHMTTHGVDFRLYFENGYELTGEFTQMIGSFVFGGFSGKEKKEIGRKGIVFGQEEWVYPDVDWENFRSPRGTHPPRKS